MVAEPPATPVTTPEALIEAIEVFELDQDPPEDVVVKVVVESTQIACVPESVPADGAAVTVPVNDTVCVVAPVEVMLNDPFTLPTEAVLVSLT